MEHGGTGGKIQPACHTLSSALILKVVGPSQQSVLKMQVMGDGWSVSKDLHPACCFSLFCFLCLSCSTFIVSQVIQTNFCNRRLVWALHLANLSSNLTSRARRVSHTRATDDLGCRDTVLSLHRKRMMISIPYTAQLSNAVHARGKLASPLRGPSGTSTWVAFFPLVPQTQGSATTGWEWCQLSYPRHVHLNVDSAKDIYKPTTACKIQKPKRMWCHCCCVGACLHKQVIYIYIYICICVCVKYRSKFAPRILSLCYLSGIATGHCIWLSRLDLQCYPSAFNFELCAFWISGPGH